MARTYTSSKTDKKTARAECFPHRMHLDTKGSIVDCADCGEKLPVFVLMLNNEDYVVEVARLGVLVSWPTQEVARA